MPYSADHKRATKARVVEAARILFNRHGFENVTIDAVMHAASLTRGGFYAHFESKEALFAEAVGSFLMGRGARWREGTLGTSAPSGPATAQQMIDGYLSSAHLGDLDGQCPMIALPSDIARASPHVRAGYQQLLTAMVGLFENNLADGPDTARPKALALAALCVGGMVLARTLPDFDLALEVRDAARKAANNLVSS